VATRGRWGSTMLANHFKVRLRREQASQGGCDWGNGNGGHEATAGVARFGIALLRRAKH